MTKITETPILWDFYASAAPLCRAVFEADPNWRRVVRATAKFALKAIKRKK